MNKHQIFQNAAEMALSTASPHGAVDVVKMANNFGINVFTEDLGKNRDAYIEFSGNRFNIVTNERQPLLRQRFSIAHEIAHFLLHRDEIIQAGRVDRENINSLDPQKEKEADTLAANILMPEPLVKEYMQHCKVDPAKPLAIENIQRIADTFCVSRYVAVIRMRDLGYFVPYLNLT